VTILDAMHDPNLFGRWFAGNFWAAWEVLLPSLFGLPLSSHQVETYKRQTQRKIPPYQAAREAWLVVGRRGGKSLIPALVAVYLACFRQYSPILAPREHATLMVIATDRKQARVIFRYISGLMDSMTLAIGHREDRRIILDALRESKPPFSPEQVVREYTSLLDCHRIDEVVGDHYAGEWPREEFRNKGIRYEVADLPKVDLYRGLQPIIPMGRVRTHRGLQIDREGILQLGHLIRSHCG
jgi:hypothetical protein